ncbi:hypothetical protein CTheo_5394 [Ceratobasidium theobromae]|uniref:RlpA-like protein double-psi beta-barrel domain-containing protein n=1 Tax=Ceratobasidium theobromae TaxID=1582974 RepID=A0A5N5QHX6_9AGAM|nr:hypothetical protein CTheo_5394 [Ceratobasidium theobromae]
MGDIAIGWPQRCKRSEEERIHQLSLTSKPRIVGLQRHLRGDNKASELQQLSFHSSSSSYSNSPVQFTMQLFSKLAVIAISTLGLASSGLAAPVESASNSTLEARGPTHNGEVTYYYPGGGYGACGTRINNGDMVAAISARAYDELMVDSNPNHSRACGKTATVTANGKTISVRVADRCGDCPYDNIDLTSAGFQRLAPLSAGRIKATWALN